jgi:Ala-tRNA(Pro) deacylase
LRRTQPDSILPGHAALAAPPGPALRPPRCPRHRPPQLFPPAGFYGAEAVALRGRLPGGHCKSLFLKDKKGGLWLAIVLEERRVDLKALAALLGGPRFSFGSPELLYETLGVRPGSVTPFALVNDPERRVAVVLDKSMLEHDPLNYHPLKNDRTTAISPADLLRFIAACGHRPCIVDLDAREDRAQPAATPA